MLQVILLGVIGNYNATNVGAFVSGNNAGIPDWLAKGYPRGTDSLLLQGAATTNNNGTKTVTAVDCPPI